MTGPEIELRPIGRVVCTRKAPADDLWDRERSTIVLDPERFGPDALAGLDLFSHLEVTFHLDRVPDEKITHGARRPRNDPKLPLMGVFAQRGKNRPNRLGHSVCRIVAVRGTEIDVRGLDAVDESPVLDLKPWVRQFGPRGRVAQPAWMDDLMARYWNEDDRAED